jgi:hypothetical protein
MDGRRQARLAALKGKRVTERLAQKNGRYFKKGNFTSDSSDGTLFRSRASG